MAGDFTTFELYGGRVQGKFFEGSHQYWVSVDGGKSSRKRGVSTISGIMDKSGALSKWQQLITAEFLLDKIEAEKLITHDEVLEAIAQCDVQKERAADIGKTIHAYIEAYILHKMGKSILPPGDSDIPEVKKGFEAFLEWESKNHVEYHASERIVYSLKHDYIGCMDLDATINGKRCVVDFKSSNGLYNSIRMQTMGYGMASEEEAGKELYQQRWGLRVSKFGEEEYYKKEYRKKEIKQFIAKMAGREVKDYPIKPYEIFEAKLLADTKKDHAIDRKAFVAAITLKNWDAETNFWQND